MASTRSPSPTSDAGSSEHLSPRAKINALLAGLDSSDDENTASKPHPTTKLTSTRTVPPRHDSDSEEEESDVEVRPRGRLAARMNGAVPSNTNAGGSKQAPPQKNAPAPVTTANDDQEEDDDLPVAPRRLQRKPREDSVLENMASRGSSPGLFVSSPVRPSPTKQAPPSDAEDDDEDILPAMKSDRFKALVERKKQERLAREAAEEARRAERRAQQDKLSSEMDQLVSDDGGDMSDIIDDDGGRILTQNANRRPEARKASKKAVEEMNRETQRMARSMQLAHEARTRKKITKNSLFERFNFRPAGHPMPEPKAASSSLPGSPPSDGVDANMKNADTPPSSPPVDDVDPDDKKAVEQEQEQQQPIFDKGKGKEVVVPENLSKSLKDKTKRRIRVKMPQLSVNYVSVDSDDELEITRTTRDKIDAIFARLPAKDTETHSLEALRTLAQVRSPSKEKRRKDDHSGMTIGQLEVYLYQKAKQQAKLERDRRLDILKAQGVVVQTAEERERQMQEVDDIVAKARREAEHIMQQERAAAKKNKSANGEVDPLAWDDSEDDNYEDPANEADGEASGLELSGSEDEEGEAKDEDEEEEEEEEEEVGHEDSAVIDVAFEDDGASEESDAEDQLPANVNKMRRSRKQAAVLSDDDEDSNTEVPKIEATPNPKVRMTHVSPNIQGATTPNAHGSVLRSAKKTFIPGLPVNGPAGLGLTQMFAGTMDDSQMSPTNQGGFVPTQSMMPDFDHFPNSNFSATMDTTAPLDTQAVETQPMTQNGIQLNLDPATQVHCLDSLMRDDVPLTQLSELIEPSQDGGFQEHTPLKERFIDAPHSTIDTVVLSGQGEPAEQQQQQDSPLVRKGRLRRKMESVATNDTVVESSLPPPQSQSRPAFGTMQDAAKKEEKMRNKRAVTEEFDRKKSKAKEMVEELAEESEDEYQGLGGYDGEDSDDESSASVKDMIDDAVGNDPDERKLAAFYADRERANDEKQVEQLFKDITNGMLRRKRGADYDLSDSDDDGEARKKLKRRQFAKMQKALFSDERVKKMAENPGNEAFLKTIEDRNSDDDMDILDVQEPSQSQSESQSADEKQQQQQQRTVPDSQPRATTSGYNSNRPPARQRRTANGRKPANIGEVRETLSDLLEDERFSSVIPATEASSGSEDEGDDDEEESGSQRSNKENRVPIHNKGSSNPRRTATGVVDRLSLKRKASSSSVSGSRMAFSAAQAGPSSSFKVPALLRRATTNSLMSTGSSESSASGATSSSNFASAAGFGDDAKVKKVATKKSGVNVVRGESGARSRLQENERRREERKVKGAERRVGVVGGLLGKGSFE
ncbi:mediator of replication checkpoint protein 1 [Geosmithia morbida]|uniref:Mediator of replication checkpoint protein 1 n=1 Tax=Geosmithia morbida TaxID=1094350 RepID=A0A9P4Z1I9_9HYPO|nr:mediator of replication checkpoint protein 1 [Geosmithia morbida]KAF4125707.1 mediator of replication checkpoint protein 1 [Geosmithia morbida]